MKAPTNRLSSGWSGKAWRKTGMLFDRPTGYRLVVLTPLPIGPNWQLAIGNRQSKSRNSIC